VASCGASSINSSFLYSTITSFTFASSDRELPGWRAWSGYAFENIWLMHPEALRQALGIAGVSTQIGTYHRRGTAEAESVQIDLLLDRRDHVINLCEAKFSDSELTVTAALSKELRRKKRLLREYSDTKKQIVTTLLTVYGTTRPVASLEGVDAVLDIGDFLPAPTQAKK
jgi:hypothetical protein